MTVKRGYSLKNGILRFSTNIKWDQNEGVEKRVKIVKYSAKAKISSLFEPFLHKSSAKQILSSSNSYLVEEYFMTFAQALANQGFFLD